VLIPAAHAQNTRKLSLSQAVQLATDASKTLKLDKTKIQNAVTHAEGVKANTALPSASVSLGYTRLSPITLPSLEIPGFKPISGVFPVYLNNYSSKVSVYEPIFGGYKSRNAQLSTQYLIEMSRLDLDKDKQEIAYNIISAWYNLYKTQENSRLIGDDMKEVQQRLTEVQNFLKEGTVTENDVLRTKLQLSNVQLAQMDADNAIDIINYNLDVMLGLPTETKLEIDTTNMFQGTALKTLDEYLKTATSQRKEFKQVEISTKLAEIDLKTAKGNYLPTFGVGGNFYFGSPSPRFIPPTDKFKATWDVGISLSWDLSTLYKNKFEVAQVQNTLDQTHQNYDILMDGIKMEIDQNYLTAMESRKKIALTLESIVQAQENYRQMKSRYDNHVALLSDLIDANNTLLQARLSYSLAKADAELAYNKLLKSVGLL
jgi:outer membrane protein TolC